MDAQWAAVVLAGGRARRLGGVDKPGLTISGRSLLDGVLAACHGAEPIVVVGPRRATMVAVHWEREQPPYAGPVAALAAGLHAVPPTAETTAVLAADLPNLRPHAVERLRAALAAASAVDGAAVNAAAAVDRAALHAASAVDGTALHAAASAVDGAVLVDERGRPQWLCGVWRTARLRAALAAAGDPVDRAVHAVLGQLTATHVPAIPGEAFDLDTPEDLRAHSRHTARPVT